MRKITKKQMLIFIIVSIVLLGIGFIGGFYTKILIDEDQLIKEKEKQTSLSALISESEITKLREKIEKDEADYGDNYQEFKTYNPYVYKKEPDRIYFKSSKIGAFYVFEKEDKNYEHLLEVIEDRMHYSVIDDFNLNCFAPDSINTMMTSGENYIIFDYDNGTLSEFDENYNKDIIFKFLENTRLYRLITYLSYYKEPILKSDLPKKEFANNTSMSGYLYMTYIDGN
ncbi:MAG TPA: hypothetical protein DIU30_05405 [Clostridiales bacterium]|jgi:hypothetical protein|nr:hypothetical protein [Clostridium sp.]OKZ57119.1 MAG: hypothetical protein BHV99_03585 [Clostridium sp. 26_21]HCQ55764.1 hypothetical protein [Clostridiales bacterium]